MIVDYLVAIRLPVLADLKTTWIGLGTFTVGV